jgi:hypothetical protein
MSNTNSEATAVVSRAKDDSLFVDKLKIKDEYAYKLIVIETVYIAIKDSLVYDLKTIR